MQIERLSGSHPHMPRVSAGLHSIGPIFNWAVHNCFEMLNRFLKAINPVVPVPLTERITLFLYIRLVSFPSLAPSSHSDQGYTCFLSLFSQINFPLLYKGSELSGQWKKCIPPSNPFHEDTGLSLHVVGRGLVFYQNLCACWKRQPQNLPSALGHMCVTNWLPQTEGPGSLMPDLWVPSALSCCVNETCFTSRQRSLQSLLRFLHHFQPTFLICVLLLGVAETATITFYDKRWKWMLVGGEWGHPERNARVTIGWSWDLTDL